VAVLVVAVAAMYPASSATRVEFSAWMKKHGKNYHGRSETEKRLQIFSDNLRRIEHLNTRYEKPVYGVNKFSDLAADEFAHLYKMPRFAPSTAEQKRKQGIHKFRANITLPTSFDWRQHGGVTPVKNQGQCGSCWAFSTTEAIESAWIIAGKGTQILGPQQIVDCDTNDDGCGGGDPPTAYQYVISAGGQETEANYPYTAEDGSCNFQPSLVAVTIQNWEYVSQNDDINTMMSGVVSLGPLSICVDASTWQYYNGGVITSGCGDSLDHCVQLVGYATSSQNVDFWSVRNSWGSDWGENGYLRVQRANDECGIGDEVTWPCVGSC